MKHNMTPHDIEQLLRQYGEDQRQQRQATETIHRMARQRTHRLTTAACVVVAALIGGTLFYRLQPQTTAETLTAELHKDIPMPEPTEAMTPAISSPAPPSHKPAPTQRRCEESANSFHHPSLENSTTDDYSPLPPVNETVPATLSTPLPTTVETPTHNPPPSTATEQPPIEAPATHKDSRKLRFSMSLGASTLSNTSNGYSINPSLTGIASNSEANATVHFSYSSSVQANVGVDYTVAASRRSRLNIGLNLSGYIQQEKVDIEHISYKYSDAVEGWMSMAQNASVITNTTNEIINDHVFSLYAGVPITFDIRLHDTDETGWQLSVTPARNIVSFQSLAIHTLNPWKLTLGIGVVMPRGIVRHISFTANLLPLYHQPSMHEVGVLVGF